MHAITQCGIGGESSFHTLWQLPNLPLTEKFGNFDPKLAKGFDQALVISSETGHVQLKHQLSPTLLYSSSAYAFRTAESAKSRQSVEFFLRFLQSVAPNRRFRSIVDVGGNDLYVAKEIKSLGDHVAVIDPICEAMDGQKIEGIQVIGKFLEQVDLSRDTPTPDLIVCRHTLEHVANPRAAIEQWLSQASNDCLYVVEVPCFACLRESLRFDAVFHQHFQYFDLESFKQLIWLSGGEFIDATLNRQGSCGGALLIAFRKAVAPQPRPEINITKRVEGIRRDIAAFETQTHLLRERLELTPGKWYAYGAGLMLATYLYHLRVEPSRFETILDDDPAKHEGGYENIDLRITDPKRMPPEAGANYLITSLENIRPIARRIADFAPARVLAPLVS